MKWKPEYCQKIKGACSSFFQNISTAQILHDVCPKNTFSPDFWGGGQLLLPASPVSYAYDLVAHISLNFLPQLYSGCTLYCETIISERGHITHALCASCIRNQTNFISNWMIQFSVAPLSAGKTIDRIRTDQRSVKICRRLPCSIVISTVIGWDSERRRRVGKLCIDFLKYGVVMWESSTIGLIHFPFRCFFSGGGWT